MNKEIVLVFGASGVLGSHCITEIEVLGFHAISVGRDLGKIENIDNISGVVWAQGENFTGDFLETSSDTWAKIWNANFNFIVDSLRMLMSQGALRAGARLVVISSAWQEVTRPRKVAYIASKSAVGGLVRGLAADFGDQKIAINAVLPGVVRSPMTERNLSKEQIKGIEGATPGGRLVEASEIAKVVGFLISNSSIGINGQSIIVDNGWSITHNV